MQSYSQGLRERVLWALGRGERPTAIARRLEVGRVWVYPVRYREQKSDKRTSFQIAAIWATMAPSLFQFPSVRIGTPRGVSASSFRLIAYIKPPSEHLFSTPNELMKRLLVLALTALPRGN
jgi:hypothetical protein